MNNSENKDYLKEIKRCLLRKEGFGLFFVIGHPSKFSEFKEDLCTELLKKKTISSLHLTKETPNLYNEIKAKHEAFITEYPNAKLDVLFLSGIELSLIPYIASGDKINEQYGGRYGFYQLDQDSLPPVMSTLQRETFKREFDFSLVFLLSPFANRFLARRCSFFYDSHFGIFELPKDNLSLSNQNYQNWEYKTLSEHIVYLESKINKVSNEVKYDWYCEIGKMKASREKYEEAIAYYDKAIALNEKKGEAKKYKEYALYDLGLV